MNSLGKRFTFTSFGESHGLAIGGVLDGVPAGISIDFSMISQALLERRGGCFTSTHGVSPRALQEPDEIEWLSGVLDGKTLGTPIAFIIRNKHAQSADYDYLKHTYRPGHADFTYQAKYGIRDWRGGGRASARETAARVVAGTIALQLLHDQGITIRTQLTQIGHETNPDKFEELLARTKANGESIGGIIACNIEGLPIGVGEPIFDKLQSHLAFAIMSINACKGFDYGTGFDQVHLLGSESNQISGGISGGISDGSPIHFRCVFKPTPSISKAQSCLNEDGTPNTIQIKGRHDTCVAIRALPVVRAMTALVLMDMHEQGLWETNKD